MVEPEQFGHDYTHAAYDDYDGDDEPAAERTGPTKWAAVVARHNESFAAAWPFMKSAYVAVRSIEQNQVVILYVHCLG